MRRPRSRKASKAGKPRSSLVLLTWLALPVSILLAVAAQSVISRFNDPKTLLPGLLLYAAAVACFLFTVRGVNGGDAGSKGSALSPAVEWSLVGVVILLAAALRVYRIGEMPFGMFIDQGYQAHAALRILHEGYRPFFGTDVMLLPAQTFYLLAAWMALFGTTEVSARLYFVFISCAAFPLIYWTFRRLSGPRTALITLFILSTLRWHINFSRNSFMAIQMPFFMFLTIALFLWALDSRRKWVWVAAGIALSAGMYNYFSYYVFPFLIAVYGAYEYWVDRKKVLRQARSVLLFVIVAFLGTSPLLVHWVAKGTISERANKVSIFKNPGGKTAVQWLAENSVSTALMFNRKGDDNFRHNTGSLPMLGSVAGILFVLGLAFALSRWKHRECFYPLTGMIVMSVPGLIGTEAPHAYRILGIVPFVALLCALPLAALWHKCETRDARRGPWMMFAVLAAVLSWGAVQSIRDYFVVQSRQMSDWGAHDPVPTVIGRRMAADGGSADHYVTPIYDNHYTVLFLSYPRRADYRSLDVPECLAPLRTEPGRGVEYDLGTGRGGLLGLIREMHPEGRLETLTGLDGKDHAHFFMVPPVSADKSRGLEAVFLPSGRRQILSRFPQDLPPGPWTADLKGCVFVEREGEWRFVLRSNGTAEMTVSGRAATTGAPLRLARGYHPVRLRVSVPSGTARIECTAMDDQGKAHPLDRKWTPLPLDRGLLATYQAAEPQRWPARVQWEPILDYENGNDFLIQQGLESVDWKGEIIAPSSGRYRFRVRSKSTARLFLDGVERRPDPVAGEWTADLEGGAHALRIQVDVFDGGQGLSFLWQKPADEGFEVVPMKAFGKVTTGY